MKPSGVLLDLEGVLYQGDKPIPGAVAAVEQLRADGLTLRFLTNTTTRPRRAIAESLADMGFIVESEHIFTPTLAAARLLRQAGISRIHLAAPAGLAEDFSDFDLATQSVDAVVLGDLYTDFDWNRLNDIFQLLRDGARLVALHKNRYCRRGDHIALDLGPFVAALEYAAATEAEVVGKPAPHFFNMALVDLGCAAGQALMVGDDPDADIAGAQACGIRAFQVRTGKYHPDAASRVEPVLLLDSVADLPGQISELAHTS